MIIDPSSLRSWKIKGSEESALGIKNESVVPLKHHDLSELEGKDIL